MFYHKKLGWLTPVLPKEPPGDCLASPLPPGSTVCSPTSANLGASAGNPILEAGSKPPSPSASGGPLTCAFPVLRSSSCSEMAAPCSNMSPLNFYASELPNLSGFVNLNPMSFGGSAVDLSSCPLNMGDCSSMGFMPCAPVPFPCAPNCVSTIPYFPAFLVTPNCAGPFPCCAPSPCADTDPTSCATRCNCSTPCIDACPSPCPCPMTPRDYSCDEGSNSCMRFFRKLRGRWGIPRPKRDTAGPPNVEDISYSPVMDNCLSN